jgi:hypothetical protein
MIFFLLVMKTIQMNDDQKFSKKIINWCIWNFQELLKKFLKFKFLFYDNSYLFFYYSSFLFNYFAFNNIRSPSFSIKNTISVINNFVFAHFQFQKYFPTFIVVLTIIFDTFINNPKSQKEAVLPKFIKAMMTVFNWTY